MSSCHLMSRQAYMYILCLFIYNSLHLQMDDQIFMSRQDNNSDYYISENSAMIPISKSSFQVEKKSSSSSNSRLANMIGHEVQAIKQQVQSIKQQVKSLKGQMNQMNNLLRILVNNSGRGDQSSNSNQRQRSRNKRSRMEQFSEADKIAIVRRIGGTFTLSQAAQETGRSLRTIQRWRQKIQKYQF